MKILSVLLVVLPLCAGVRFDEASQSYILTSGGNELQLDAKTGEMSKFGPAGRTVPVKASCQAEVFSGPVSNSVIEGRVHFRHTDAHTGVTTEIWYTAAGETGVFTRDATVSADRTVVTPEASLCWSLPPRAYELTYLWGGWGQERQVATERLGPGRRVFSSDRGRSTSTYSPWFTLHDKQTGVRYAAQLAWSGNWEMGFERLPATGDKPIDAVPLEVWLGMRTTLGHEMKLEKRSFQLPMVAFTATTGDLDDAANNLHRYQREFVTPKIASNTPPLVQFNSWYPYQGTLKVAELKQLADAAVKLGAETFVLDSGWYNRKDWSKELGDYTASRIVFPNGLEELANHVRSRGMKFGIWVEIENLGTECEMFKQHSGDWCFQYDGKPVIQSSRCMLNFAKPEVRKWARGVVDRLVKDYGIEWIKIDYNIDIGNRFDSPSGLALADHVRGYYGWLDEIRAAHPKLVVENCSSGGLRLDLGIIGHTHTTWLSDEVMAVPSLQLAYGCTLEFTPEVCNHWMVGDEGSGKVDFSKEAGWFDFLFRVPMNGQFGISSRAFEWPPNLMARGVAAVSDYKRIRETIAGADVYHLTPPPDHLHPTGWIAIEYVKGDRAVVLAYRLPEGPEKISLMVRGKSDPVEVSLDQPWRSAIVELTGISNPGR